MRLIFYFFLLVQVKLGGSLWAKGKCDSTVQDLNLAERLSIASPYDFANIFPMVARRRISNSRAQDRDTT